MLYDCLLWTHSWVVELDWLDAYTFTIDRHKRMGALDGIKNELPSIPVLAVLLPGQHVYRENVFTNSLLDFLRYNPMAATFEWSDLVDEVILYCEAELPLNVHKARFLAHTAVHTDMFFQVHPGCDALAFVADYQSEVAARKIYRCFLWFAKKPIKDSKCFAPLESFWVTEVTRRILRSLHCFDDEYVVPGTVSHLCYVSPHPLCS